MGNPAKAFIAKSAVFAGVSLTDLVNLDDGESGDPVALTTDNAQTVNGHYIDSIKGSIQVTLTDNELRNNAVIFLGRTGSLVIAYGQRAQGKGFTASKTHTITYANSQIVDIKQSSGVTGNGQLVLTFVAYDPAGVAVSTQSVA